MNNASPYSYHIFLFPFKWEVKTAKALHETSIEERTDLDKIKACIPEQIWKRFSFDIRPSHSGNTYNEFSYFYEHARPILSLDLNRDDQGQAIQLLQYSYEPNEDQHPIYEINILGSPSIELSIDEMTLTLYKTGIGVLAFFLSNYTVSDFNTILKINEYGRRFYPQFLDQTNAIEDTSSKLTTGTKYSFLANSITLRNLPGLDVNAEISEDFSHYDTFATLRQGPFVLPKHIKMLLGNKFRTKYEQPQLNDVIVTPIIDDRMYIMCFLLSTPLIEKWSKYDDLKLQYEYQNNKEWYRLLFVDDSTASCANLNMLKKLIDESSYARWIGQSTLVDEKLTVQGSIWGASRYSMVAVAADGYFNKVHLLNHFKTVYFQLVLLSITQRASAVSYSDEVSRLSKQIKRASSLQPEQIKQFSDLQQSFLVFKSIINLHEVTAQEQGIELYNLIRDRMNVEVEINYLESLIQSLYDSVQLESENARNRASYWLTLVATWFLPAGFIATLFGISFITERTSLTGNPDWRILCTWGIIIGIGGIIAFILWASLKQFKIFKREKS